MFSILPWHRNTDRDAASTRCHILPREDETVAVCRGRRRRRRWERANEEERQDAHTPRPFLARHFSAHSLPPFTVANIGGERMCQQRLLHSGYTRMCVSGRQPLAVFLGPSCCCCMHARIKLRKGGMDGRTDTFVATTCLPFFLHGSGEGPPAAYAVHCTHGHI